MHSVLVNGKMTNLIFYLLTTTTHPTNDEDKCYFPWTCVCVCVYQSKRICNQLVKQKGLITEENHKKYEQVEEGAKREEKSFVNHIHLHVTANWLTLTEDIICHNWREFACPVSTHTRWRCKESERKFSHFVSQIL